MKKQLTIIALITLVICVSLSGCDQVSNSTNTEKNRFVGTWQNETKTTVNVTFTLNFNSNGTYTGRTSVGQTQNGTWDIKDNKLVTKTLRKSNGVVYNDTVITFEFTYAFSNNDRTLTLTNTATGGSQVFTKQ